MARLGWIRQISCLFAILLSIWTLGTEAHLIDRSSCINLREYDFQGRIHSWGNVLSQLTTSLDETADMATIAYNTMRAVADRSGSRFDKKRTKNMFIALQGDSGELRVTRQPRWRTVYDDVRELGTFLSNRARKPSDIFCGDAHLVRYELLSNGRKVPAPAPRKYRSQVVGFQYYDPILRAAGMTEMNSWWTPNVAACAESGSTATNVLNTYIIVCAGAFQETGLTIGSERTYDWSHSARAYLSSIDYWKRFLSYTLLHELIHLQFKYTDHVLSTHPFRKAYGYSGATELLRRFPDRVPTNDDNLGILMLALFMSGDDWSEGYAQNENDLENCGD